MISGNQTWQNALLQNPKQALYTFEITDFGLVLASFTTVGAGITLGGYGITVYGVGGYGI